MFHDVYVCGAGFFVSFEGIKFNFVICLVIGIYNQWHMFMCPLLFYLRMVTNPITKHCIIIFISSMLWQLKS